MKILTGLTLLTKVHQTTSLHLPFNVLHHFCLVRRGEEAGTPVSLRHRGASHMHTGVETASLDHESIQGLQLLDPRIEKLEIEVQELKRRMDATEALSSGQKLVG